MNRYDEWRREREWRSRDRDGRSEHGERGGERPRRESFYPGNPGFEQNASSGRTAGGDDRQPYSQNSYGRYPGQQRRGGRDNEGRSSGDEPRWSEPRYGQREPYNPPGYGNAPSYRGSRYSESQYGSDRSRRAYGNENYERSRFGGAGLESGFDRGGAFGEGPFADTSEAPRFYGTGNYADGGASYGGGYDERQGQRRYGSLYGSEEQHLEEQYRAPQQRYRSGPKGYTRSDDRLREEISERLMMADSIDSSDVTIVVKEAKVTLEGSVPNRRMKHAIEDLADQCPGVQDVDNRIRVQQPLPKDK